MSTDRVSASPTDVGVRFEELPALRGHIGRITLDLPQRLNALTLQSVQAIHAQLQRWRDDPRIALVWMDSSSDKAFCVGADLYQLFTAMRTPDQSVLPFFAAEYQLDYFVHRYPKPVIAWMHGIVMGGGLGLGIGASHRILTETSVCAMPEISIGLFPDVGGSWFLGRLPAGIGRYLGLTGARLKTADALFAGLADVPVQSMRRPAVLSALLELDWHVDSVAAHHAVRSVLLKSADWSLAEHSELAKRWSAIAAVCAAPDPTSFTRAVHALAASDEWVAPHARLLAEGSALSAALAWELQRRLRHASLADVFRLELHAAVGCAEFDFEEGIRALIIDKDRQPQWRYQHVSDVSPATLDELLRPRWLGEHPLAGLEVCTGSSTA